MKNSFSVILIWNVNGALISNTFCKTKPKNSTCKQELIFATGVNIYTKKGIRNKNKTLICGLAIIFKELVRRRAQVTLASK